jgi:serine protease Do
MISHIKTTATFILLAFAAAVSVAAALPSVAAPAIDEKKIEVIAKMVAPSVVRVEARNGVYKVATGVVIDKDGHIVTTALISPREGKITVVTADGKKIAAEFKGLDTQTQIAVIQAKEKTLTPIALGKSADLKPGAWIGVIGLSPEQTTAVTQGIVSSVAADKIRLNVWVVPGASGSPVVNEAGQMIGLLRGPYIDDSTVLFEFRERQMVGSGTVLSRAEAPSAGMALAVPVDIVSAVAADIKKSGKVERGWLGVSVGESDGKVEITAIDPKSPAELAKLKVGDVILKIEKVDITSGPTLSTEVRTRKPGTDVTVRIEREGKPLEMKVKLGEYTEVEARKELELAFPRLFPPNSPLPEFRNLPKTAPLPLTPESRRNNFTLLENRKFIGVTLQELTKEMAEFFGAKDGYGLWVAELADDSPAKKAGVKVGDVILKADGKKVESATELSAMIQDKKKGDRITLEIIRDKKPLTLEVEIAEEERSLESVFGWSREASKKLVQEYQKFYQDYQMQMKESQKSGQDSLRKLTEELQKNRKEMTQGLQKSKELNSIFRLFRNTYRI